jgi:hypothetical protein
MRHLAAPALPESTAIAIPWRQKAKSPVKRPGFLNIFSSLGNGCRVEWY